VEKSLREKQSIFAKNVAKLILYIFEQGYECTLSECYRTPEQAWINALPFNSSLEALAPGMSRKVYPYRVGGKGIRKSLHCERLAIDINLFKDGVYLATTEAHKPFGDYWESLHPLNRWGGRWEDGNHYEMSQNKQKKGHVNG